MILQYTSSNGQTFDLKAKRFRARTANFHDFSWTPKTVDQQYGTRVYRFDKAACSYTALISVFGSLEERKQWLNVLHDAFESDIRNMTPGRITHGMYSISCYIVASSTYYEEPYTQNEISIYCPYPFWGREETYHLTVEDVQIYEYLDYPYGYAYDYRGQLPGYAMVDNRGSGAADWQLAIYGPCVNPMIVIDDIKVGVNAAIGAGETVVISSKEKTVMKGDKSLFNQRYKESSIFEKIPAGQHAVFWSGSYDCDLTIYEERSEPLWI